MQLADSSMPAPSAAETPRTLTIAELSALSALPPSTIKFYIREGLLPPPRKTRGARPHYDPRHLQRLRLIKKIRGDGDVSLAKVREIVRLIDDEERADAGRNGADAELLKGDIVAAAVRVFREKGYEAATIGDLVAAARVGRSTFYKHFHDKKDLFIECIKHVLLNKPAARRPEGGAEPGDETDLLAAFERNARPYFNAYPAWLDMLKLLRAAAINHPDEFAQSLDEVIRLKIDLLRGSIEKGIARGLFRKINPTLMTVMLLGLQDYHSHLEKDLTEKSPEQLYDDAKDIILYGILKR